MVALCRVALDLLLGELLVDVSVAFQQNFRNKISLARPHPRSLSQNANEPRFFAFAARYPEEDASYAWRGVEGLT